MPEMVTAAKWVCTSSPYRFVAGRVLLPWALRGLGPADLGPADLGPADPGPADLRPAGVGSADPRLGGHALEIGAGSGGMAARLLARYPALQLVVSDYDPSMVAVARTAVSEFGRRATVQQADAAWLPFGDEHFDVVFSFAMLHHVGDWAAAVREALRVLRPGGRLVGYDVLDGTLARLLHCGEGDAVRMIRRGELDAQLARLPATEVRIRTSGAGLVVRFTATKSAAGP